MNRWLAAAAALSGCLSAPPSGTGAPPGDDGSPSGPHVEVLGAFSRDHFTYGDTVNDDLVAAIAFDGAFYLLHLPAIDGGLSDVLDAASLVELPFAPVGLVGADVDADQKIDVVAAGADGELAVIGNRPDGLALIDQEVSVDDGAPLANITDVQAPDLSGDERIFLFGPDGMWKSETLDGTGTIHLRQLVPVMSNVSPPDVVFATHDDVASWFVGLAHATAVDLWVNSAFTLETGNDRIAYTAPGPPLFGTWRHLPGPRADFFGVDAANEVLWVSQLLTGDAEESRRIADVATGTLRDLTTTQQPDGYDLITVSAEPGNMVGVQVIIDIATPTQELGAQVSTVLGSSIDTGSPLWVRPVTLGATPFAGQDVLVLDRAGHLLCVGFDADHTALSPCGEDSLDDRIAGWTGRAPISGSSTSDRSDW